MPNIASLEDLARDSQADGLIPLVRRFGRDLNLGELGWPEPEVWAARVLLQSEPEADGEALDSIPFEHFCQTLVAPLMALSATQQQRLFGRTIAGLDREARGQRLKQFFSLNVGLSTVEKVCWLTGERFGSLRPWSEERLLNVFAHSYLMSLETLRKKMVEQGGVAALAASLVSPPDQEPQPLATRVVTRCLMKPPPYHHECWPQLLKRCSPLERYVLVSRLAGKLDLSWGQRQETLMAILAEHYGVAAETLAAAHALEDLTQIVERLEKDGPDGLKAVVLRPLAAFRPALAMSQQDKVKFPTWVECKYDGIRILLHKELDGFGNLRLAAYTRRRNDWSEMIPGLRPLLSSLVPSTLILDGELHGRILNLDGVSRPANVYEVHQCLRGEVSIPLRYVAFDLLYCNGQDLTGLPFQQRRQQLEAVLSLRTQASGLPIEISQGSLVGDQEQLNRLYQQYRRQGHEGCMIKDLQAPYPLALRSPAWQKRKPLDTVDLVLTSAYWGEGSRPGARLFDSYSISARVATQGGWKEVGTVAGLDQALTSQLVAEIWSQQLLTGQERSRSSSRGLAHGVELRPHLVVTVAYEDLLMDRATQELSLRSPRIQGLRSGELPLHETTSWEELERKALGLRLS